MLICRENRQAADVDEGSIEVPSMRADTPDRVRDLA
jgi:hypothetical protein